MSEHGMIELGHTDVACRRIGILRRVMNDQCIDVAEVVQDYATCMERIYRFTHRVTNRSFEAELDFYRSTTEDVIATLVSRCEGLYPRKPQPGASWGRNCPVPDRSRNSWNRGWPTPKRTK